MFPGLPPLVAKKKRTGVEVRLPQGAVLRRLADEVDGHLFGVGVDAAVEEACLLDGEGERLGDI